MIVEDESANNTNEEKAKEIPKQKTCHICGATLRRSNFKRHLKTKKHKDCLYMLSELFDMII